MKPPATSLFFEVGGTPVAKPRMTRRDIWAPSPAARRYFAWTDLVRTTVRRQMTQDYRLHDPITEPIALAAIFHLPVPRSLSKPEQHKRAGSVHVIKPDLKNLIAALEDALNRVLWQDDSQIYRYRGLTKTWTKERQGFIQLTVFL